MKVIFSIALIILSHFLLAQAEMNIENIEFKDSNSNYHFFTFSIQDSVPTEETPIFHLKVSNDDSISINLIRNSESMHVQVKKSLPGNFRGLREGPNTKFFENNALVEYWELLNILD